MSDNRDLTVPRFLKLKVVGQDGTEIHFKLNVRTKFVKVKAAYCHRLGLPINAFRFLFDGHRINDDETPEALQMQNDDLVEVYQEQTGGNAPEILRSRLL